MTVKELIKELKKMPADSDVEFVSHYHNSGLVDEQENITHVELVEIIEGDKTYKIVILQQ